MWMLMKTQNNRHCRMIVLLVLLGMSQLFITRVLADDGKAGFWMYQRKGVNWFNEKPTVEWLVAARDAGFEVIRLAPDKWQSAQRDFLIGTADAYNGLVEEDFLTLRTVLDQADSVGLKIVLTALSLPGARWRQHNNGDFDYRLWRDSTYLPQVVSYWRDLAGRLAGHPAIAAYNIKNEPIPEKAIGLKSNREADVLAWYAGVEGSSADLNRFNKAAVAAIREVDPLTPIVLDCGSWAAPSSICYLRPLDDSTILYSIHMYEPWDYTTKRVNDGRFSYPLPDTALTQQGTYPECYLNKDGLKRILRPVSDWQQKYRIPSNRIFVGEFGCDRRVEGVERYLEDLINIFNANGWHWVLYSFREDSWDAMDYELGSKPLGWAYWQAVERGEHPSKNRIANPIWDVITAGLRAK